MDTLDLVLVAIRVWLGIVMIAHGVGHVRNLEGTARWFESIGFRAAPLQARMSAFGELAIGSALVIGLLTGPALAGLIATMTVAFWSVHRAAGFFVYARPDEGWEYVATLTLVAAGLAVTGPGLVSVDHVLGLAGPLDGAVGLGIAAAGVLAGAAQLAATWRPTT